MSNQNDNMLRPTCEYHYFPYSINFSNFYLVQGANYMRLGGFSLSKI